MRQLIPTERQCFQTYQSLEDFVQMRKLIIIQIQLCQTCQSLEWLVV